MIVKYDEDNFSIKLYRNFVKGKLVGLMEVIPIDELLEVWAERKTENSSENPNNCETCRFELYCLEMCEGCCEWDSHYEPKDEPQTYITEDRDTQILDAWQVHHRSTTSVEDEPQTEDFQDWKDQMWAEAIVTDPQTERKDK